MTSPPRSEAMADWVRGISETTEGLRKARKWLMITGILCMIAGVAAILVPAVASVTIAIFIGWVLIYAGVVMLVHIFRGSLPGPKGLRILEAVLTLVAGLYIVIFPLDGTVSLTFALAVWFLVSGGLLALGAWSDRGSPVATFMGINAVFSLILGVLIAVDLPSSASWAIGLLVGIHLVFWGARAMIAAGLLKALTDGESRSSRVPPTAAPSH
jgi:uncharacterized membrane protein HdeD (DUF308 family)